MRTLEDMRPSQDQIVADLVACPDRMVIADMGAGKTSATLTGFSALKALGDVRRGIILAPPLPAASVWPREPAKWQHLQHLTVEFIDGTPAQRKKRLLASTADLVVVSIYQTKWLNEILETLPEDHPLFDLLAVDEISRFRGPRSKLARALEPVIERFQNRWGLTGTPRPNGHEDLFKPYEFISGGEIWGGTKFDDWRRQNFMPMDNKGYTWKVHSFAAKKIDARVAQWTTVVDVNLELPPLNEGDDWDIEIDLAADCREAYDQMLKEFLILCADKKGDTLSIDDIVAAAGSAAVQSGKLSQLTQGFVYSHEIDEETEEKETIVAATYKDAKMAALKEFMLDRGTEPVIVCYQYQQSLRQLLDELGDDTPVIGGGISQKRKLQLVDLFAEGKVDTLLVHPASMGHGVDGLQQAGRLFLWYDLTWSGEQYDQTIKRLARPGQTKPVISRRLVARGTVDLIKRARVEGKGQEQDAWERMLSERGLRL